MPEDLGQNGESDGEEQIRLNVILTLTPSPGDGYMSRERAIADLTDMFQSVLKQNNVEIRNGAKVMARSMLLAETTHLLAKVHFLLKHSDQFQENANLSLEDAAKAVCLVIEEFFGGEDEVPPAE